MPIFDSRQFLKGIKTEKNFNPFYLIVGEEETLVSECFKNLKTAFFARYKNDFPDFNFENFHGDQADPEKIMESCRTFPMGTEKKLVVLHDLEKFSENSKKILKEYCVSPNSSTCLVLLWNFKPNQALNHELTLEILKTGSVVKCWKPFENDRPQWIREEAAKLGKKISPEACHLLSEESGDSLSELKSEIEKLDLYTAGKKEIEADDVSEAMSFRRNRSLWDCLDALESGNARKSGQILEFCLEQGEEPVKILALLLKSFKKMAGIEPSYPSFKKAKITKKIGRDKLLALLKELKKSDLMLKSGHHIESAQLEKIMNLAASTAKPDSVS